jgi:transposase
MDLLPCLLPLETSLRVNDLAVDADAHALTVELEAIAPSCPCPSCQLPAERIHSHYHRTVVDLPWAELLVRLSLHVRKFFCDNAACVRKIFTERLPSLLAPHARRTLRLTQQQQHLGLALGGNPSASLSAELDCGASRNTFLRLVRRLPLPEAAAPEVVGIDDWAWKKGQRYGTIICDLERQCPIALLEDRDAETLAAWLKQHPTIRIVARDRAGIYAEGATKGAPQAIQVADRFHLLGNLADTLLPIFEQHAKLLREVTPSTASAASTELPPAVVEHQSSAATEAVVRMLPPPTPSPKHQAQAEQRRQARLARYERARELHAQGWPIRAIGRELGLNRNTVRVYLRASSFPERQPRVLRQGGVLEPFIPYLIERWNVGCRNGTVLWKEIIEQGYTGKRVTVFSFVTRLRKALGIPAKNRSIREGKVAVPEERPLTPRNAVWQVMKRPEKRDLATDERLQQLRQAHPELDEGIALTEDFATLIRTRDAMALDRWLESAASSRLRPFQSFAASLRRDYDAVRAGVEQRWSTGPVEGEINKLKMVKRAMFGRAGFPLLQRRVLLAG